MFIPDPDFSIPDPGSERHRILDPQRIIHVFFTPKIVTKLLDTCFLEITFGDGNEGKMRLMIFVTGREVRQ